MTTLFGTDGIRARAGEFPLDRKTVEIIGSALAKLFIERVGRRPRFVTGRDTRESGPWIESALHAGARADEAADIESAGVITTPGVAMLTGRFGFDAGVVISASHNPFEDNGIKVFLPDGRKLDDDGERQLEEQILAGDAPRTAAEVLIDDSRAAEFRKAYVEHFAERFPKLRLDGLRMVADCANGASTGIAKQLFERFGADIITINDSPNGRNINRDCGSLHLGGLQRKVVECHADFGVAFDGDADRALFVDENGNIVDGDAALWILALRMSDEGRLTNTQVVATVMSNVGLEVALRSRNIELVRTQVGDKYVLDELLKRGAAIGGEQSGHIIFPNESLVGDGLMTTLFVLDALKARDRKLSEAVAGFTRYPQILINIRVREKKPFDTVEAIAKASADIERELDGSGRLLLRYSGTEDLARVMIEGRDQAEIERQANYLADIIKAELA
jgi:phosphoglucosamine mutase